MEQKQQLIIVGILLVLLVVAYMVYQNQQNKLVELEDRLKKEEEEKNSVYVYQVNPWLPSYRRHDFHRGGLHHRRR